MTETMLCAGSSYGLLARNDVLKVVELVSGRTLNVLASVEDMQINRLTHKDIVLAKTNSTGQILVLCSKTGLIIIIKIRDFDTRKYSYKSMRVVFKDGAVLVHRCALENQYAFSVKECEFSQNALILVPFMLTINDGMIFVRVQPLLHKSFFVRLMIEKNDKQLDGLPTRQALLSPEWRFVYDQGVLDWQVTNSHLYILTHTCLVLADISGYNPTPLCLALPKDRVNLIVAPEYKAYVQKLMQYKVVDELSSIKDNSDDSSESIVESLLETVLSTHPNQRARIRRYIRQCEKLKPHLEIPFINALTVKVEFDLKDTTSHEFYTSYNDIDISLACPWIKIAITNENIYLNTIDGIFYFTGNGWTLLKENKTGLPIYASNMISSNTCLYIQKDQEASWEIVHPDSSIELPPIKDDLVYVSAKLLVSTKCPIFIAASLPNTILY